jgi:hypothetical protein
MHLSRLLSAALAAASLGLSCASAASFSTNFDSQPDGSLASLFANADFSFHNGLFGPLQDGFGDDIPGSEQWQIDTQADLDFPLAVIATGAVPGGYGAAPSTPNALNGVDQSVLLVFNQRVDITNFSVTLDNSAFGNLFASPITFVDGGTVIASSPADQTVPGLVVTTASAIGVKMIVLPAGAYYDNLSFDYTASAIPEPSSFAALAGLASLALAATRRRRA